MVSSWSSSDRPISRDTVDRREHLRERRTRWAVCQRTSGRAVIRHGRAEGHNRRALSASVLTGRCSGIGDLRHLLINHGHSEPALLAVASPHRWRCRGRGVPIETSSRTAAPIRAVNATVVSDCRAATSPLQCKRPAFSGFLDITGQRIVGFSVSLIVTVNGSYWCCQTDPSRYKSPCIPTRSRPHRRRANDAV